MKKHNCVSLVLLFSISLSFAQWIDNGTNLTTTDNVGIGTTSPQHKLDVNGTGKFGSYALIVSGVSAGYYQDASNGAYRSLNAGGNTGYYFQNYNGAATTMFVGLQGTHAGNVGIGTTSPQYKLDVNGTGKFGSYALIGTGVSAGYYQDASNGAYRSLNAGGNTGYYFQNYNGAATTMFVGLQGTYAGNVGIGTTSPDMKLTVKGNIHAEEVKIDLNVPAPDYVFKEDYQLRTLKEVENFVKKNRHLPEIPSAKEFKENGVLQAEMDMNLLKKIEELTLYTIQQEKQLTRQSKEIEELKSLVQQLLESKK